MRKSLAYIFVAVIVTASQLSRAAETETQIDLCPEEISNRTDSDFDPLREFGKSVISSGVGAQSGRALAQAAETVTVGYLIREAGMISGRTIVWICEVANPFVVAIGYVLIPTTPAKCDVIYSPDPDCKRRKPCVVKIH
jgi:hypothetical protein